MSPSGFASSRTSRTALLMTPPEHRLPHPSNAYVNARLRLIITGSAQRVSSSATCPFTARARTSCTIEKDTPLDAWVYDINQTTQKQWRVHTCQVLQRGHARTLYHQRLTWDAWSRPCAAQLYLTAGATGHCILRPYVLRGHRTSSTSQRSPYHILHTAVPGPKPGRREFTGRVLCSTLLKLYATALDIQHGNMIAQEPRVGGSADQQPPVVQHRAAASILSTGTKHNGQATHLGSQIWTAEAGATRVITLTLHVYRIHALYPSHILLVGQLLPTSMPGPDSPIYAVCFGDLTFRMPTDPALRLRSTLLQGQAVTAPKRNTTFSLCPHLMCRSCLLRCWKLTINYNCLRHMHHDGSARCPPGMNGPSRWSRFGPAGPRPILCKTPYHFRENVFLACRVSTTPLRCNPLLAQYSKGPIGQTTCILLSALHPVPIQHPFTLAPHTCGEMGRNGPSPSAKLKSSRRPPSRFRHPATGTAGAGDAASSSAKATPPAWRSPQADQGWREAWAWEASDTGWGSAWSATDEATASWWNQWDGQQWTSRMPPPPPPPPKRSGVPSTEHPEN